MYGEEVILTNRQRLSLSLANIFYDTFSLCEGESIRKQLGKSGYGNEKFFRNENLIK